MRSLLFVLVLVIPSSRSEEPPPLALPSLDFLSSFVDAHSLSGLEIWVPVVPESLGRLVRYRR